MTNLLIYICIGTVWMALGMGMLLFCGKVLEQTMKWNWFIVMVLLKMFAWPLDMASVIYLFIRNKNIDSEQQERETKFLDDLYYD